ncbi:hypothetical protein FZEAL_8164 [Fusarium zealandicum]|uniref:Uncharacterized protein n=1 Tax=Fusarium zealandicum TaxID=1053134 RepID=A0A8H4UED3_9HYPO|nr:hypothetical protein FZEAL_8164 [Fusarium zealandicum]
MNGHTQSVIGGEYFTFPDIALGLQRAAIKLSYKGATSGSTLDNWTTSLPYAGSVLRSAELQCVTSNAAHLAPCHQALGQNNTEPLIKLKGDDSIAMLRNTTYTTLAISKDEILLLGNPTITAKVKVAMPCSRWEGMTQPRSRFGSPFETQHHSEDHDKLPSMWAAASPRRRTTAGRAPCRSTKSGTPMPGHQPPSTQARSQRLSALAVERVQRN